MSFPIRPSIRPRHLARAGALALLALAPACINSRSDRGVEVRWHDLGPDAFVPGTTTREDVLEQLGPPSQVLDLEDGSAFYYLLERTDASGYVLLVYNDRKEVTRYERAIFFFDAAHVLTEFAVTEPGS